MDSLLASARILLLQGSWWETIRQGAENIWQSLQHPDLSKFLVIGALLFSIGVAGVLVRRNIIVIFMSIELILNAANLNFIAFSRYLQDAGNVNAVAGQ